MFPQTFSRDTEAVKFGILGGSGEGLPVIMLAKQPWPQTLLKRLRMQCLCTPGIHMWLPGVSSVLGFDLQLDQEWKGQTEV